MSKIELFHGSDHIIEQPNILTGIGVLPNNIPNNTEKPIPGKSNAKINVSGWP